MARLSRALELDYGKPRVAGTAIGLTSSQHQKLRVQRGVNLIEKTPGNAEHGD